MRGGNSSVREANRPRQLVAAVLVFQGKAQNKENEWELPCKPSVLFSDKLNKIVYFLGDD